MKSEKNNTSNTINTETAMVASAHANTHVRANTQV